MYTVKLLGYICKLYVYCKISWATFVNYMYTVKLVGYICKLYVYCKITRLHV
jgi:hypothetical protein